jgi:TP901 family phage tail tape measure protein
MSAGNFGNDPSKLGMDASQFNAEVDKIAAKITHLNTVFTRAINRLGGVQNISEGTAVAFQHVDDAGNRFAVTLKKVEGELQVTSKNLKIASDLLGNNTQKLKNETAEWERWIRTLAKANATIADQKVTAEIERRNKVLAAQKALYDQLAAAAKRANDANIAAQQARATRAGQFAGTQLLQQSMPLVPATPAEVNRVTNTIGKIQAEIQKGAIGARRALSIIAQAQAGTNQVFTGAAARIARLGIQLQNAVNQMGQAHNRIQQQNTASAASFRRHQQAGEEAARRLIITWRDVGRLFVIQALHTVIGRFVLGMREAVTTTAQFQVRISEIRSISQDAQQSFSDWSASVRTLSDQFGNPILDVAEGTYETISNQIAKGAETADFMAKALRFAATTVSSTADSVNLLSSVMNAYKFNITDVDRISAQLFRTIDLGRVRAQDIANELGRVTPVAAGLGISFEELSAAIAVITIQGVTPSETLTSLFGVMNKLLKPTGEMKDFLSEMGFATGEAAVAALGFEGVLQKVALAAEAGDARLSDLFNEIRARRGITAMVRSLDTYQDALNKIRNDSMDKFIAAQDIINESAGKQFQIEMNRIKNIFAEDFGAPFIESITSIGQSSIGLLTPLAILGKTTLEVFGGLEKSTNSAGKEVFRLSDIFRSTIQTLTVGIQIYLTYRAVTLAAAAATAIQARALHTQALAARFSAINNTTLTATQVTLARSSRFLAAALTPTNIVIAGFAAYFILEQRRVRLLDESARKSDELTARLGEDVAKQTRDFNRALQDQQAIYNKALDNRLKADLQYTANARITYNRAAKAQEERNEAIVRRLKDEFDLTLDTVQDKISELEQQARQAGTNIRDATRTLFEQREGLTAGRFNRQLRLLPEPEQIRAMFAEIQRLQQEAATKLNAPTSDANIAQENLRAATKLQQQADQITNDLLEKQVDLAKKRQEIEENIAEELAKGGDRNLVRAQREVYESARKLEQEAKASSGKRKTDLENQLKTQRELASEQLQSARDKTVDNTAQRRLDDMQEELNLIDQQQRELGTTASLEQTITAELAKRDQFMQDYIKQQEQIKKLAEQEAEVRKKQQEQLRTLFQQAAGFKVKTGDVKTAQDARKIKNDFDEIMLQLEALQLQGLPIDQSVLLDLAKQRVEIFAQADLEIAKHSLDTNAEKLQKEKEQFQKHLEELNRRREQAEGRRVGGIQTLFNIGDILRPAMFASSAGKAAELVAGDIIDKRFKEFTEAIEELQESPSAQNANRVQEIFEQLQITLVKFNTLPFTSGRPEDIVIRESTDPSKRITGATLQQQVTDAIKAVLTSPAIEAKNKADAQAAEAKLKQMNLDLDAAKKQLESVHGATAATQNLTQAFSTSAAEMDRLRTATRDAAARLETLATRPGHDIKKFARGGPVIPLFRPHGTDTVPAMLSPGEYVINAYSTKRFYSLLEAINNSKPQYYAGGGHVTSGRVSNISSMSVGDTNIGPVSFNVTATGNTKVDAQALWSEFQGLARRGAISPIKESKS